MNEPLFKVGDWVVLKDNAVNKKSITIKEIGEIREIL